MQTIVMSDEHQRNSGLLSEFDQALLADPDRRESDARDELVGNLYSRLYETFSELEFLYMVLTDDELQRVFTGPEAMQSSLRSRCQHTLAFLYTGLQSAGDDVTYRLQSAIEDAEAARDHNASVTIDIVTQPLLPPEDVVQALKDGHHDRVSAAEVERVWYDDSIPPADVVAAFTALGVEDLTVEDVRAERAGTAGIERMPAPVVVNVETAVESTPDDESVS